MGDWDGNGQKTPGSWSSGAFWFTNDLGTPATWTGIWMGAFPTVAPVAGRFQVGVDHDCFGVVQLDYQPPNVGFPLHYRCDFSTTVEVTVELTAELTAEVTMSASPTASPTASQHQLTSQRRCYFRLCHHHRRSRPHPSQRRLQFRRLHLRYCRPLSLLC